MGNLLLALLHLAVVPARLCGHGGVRAVVAENLLLKQQLTVLRRGRRRAPKLSVSDRLLCGFESLFLTPSRIRKLAVALRPSTLLAFHQALVRRKYRRLFSSTARPRRPGPKGRDDAVIRAIVELKSRNPRFGCPRIARIISQTFGVDIDKNVMYQKFVRTSMLRLQQQQMLLRSKLDRVYEDRLSDAIPEELWNAKSAELQEELRRVRTQMERHEHASEAYETTGLQILELAQTA